MRRALTVGALGCLALVALHGVTRPVLRSEGSDLEEMTQELEQLSQDFVYSADDCAQRLEADHPHTQMLLQIQQLLSLSAIQKDQKEMQKLIDKLKKVKGLRGPRGWAGAPGKCGPGNPGKQGKNGTIGKDAPPGKNGRPGRPGLNGRNGRNGRRGKHGRRGKRGKPGRPGLPGKPGISGIPGKPGVLGRKGGQGMTGLSGSRGYTGRRGRPGLPGRRGPTGIKGKPGRGGRRGRVGAMGTPGFKGKHGVHGAKGKFGLRGTRGSSGLRGGRGRKGRPGNNGKNRKVYHERSHLIGMVVDATTGLEIKGAKITFTQRGLPAGAAVSKEFGRYYVSLPSGPIKATAVKGGYYPAVRRATTTRTGVRRLDIIMSPKLRKGQLRFILTWKAPEIQLDAALVTPTGCVVSGANRKCTDRRTRSYAVYDMEKCAHRGPQTITVHRFQGGNYWYLVRQVSKVGRISTSRVVVRVVNSCFKGGTRAYTVSKYGKVVGKAKGATWCVTQVSGSIMRKSLTHSGWCGKALSNCAGTQGWKVKDKVRRAVRRIKEDKAHLPKAVERERIQIRKQASACQAKNIQDGVDYQGNDLVKGGLKSSTAATCCKKCTQTPGCKYWTQAKDKHKCWVKGSAKGWQRQSNRISGTLVKKKNGKIAKAKDLKKPPRVRRRVRIRKNKTGRPGRVRTNTRIAIRKGRGASRRRRTRRGVRIRKNKTGRRGRRGTRFRVRIRKNKTGKKVAKVLKKVLQKVLKKVPSRAKRAVKKVLKQIKKVAKAPPKSRKKKRRVKKLKKKLRKLKKKLPRRAKKKLKVIVKKLRKMVKARRRRVTQVNTKIKIRRGGKQARRRRTQKNDRIRVRKNKPSRSGRRRRTYIRTDTQIRTKQNDRITIRKVSRGRRRGKKLCNPAEVKGQEFYSWDRKGRYCYHIIAGKVLEQDYRTRRAGRCNAAGFRKSVTIGRGRGITDRYPNGDSKSCPGGKKRSATLRVDRDPSTKAVTASVTEPSTCTYVITIKSPSCSKVAKVAKAQIGGCVQCRDTSSFLKKHDYQGSDLVKGGVKARSPADCCKKCRENKKCRYWTYGTKRPRKGRCWLKKNSKGSQRQLNRESGRVCRTKKGKRSTRPLSFLAGAFVPKAAPDDSWMRRYPAREDSDVSLQEGHVDAP